MFRLNLLRWLCPAVAACAGAVSSTEAPAQMQSLFGGRGPINNAAVPMGNTRTGGSFGTSPFGGPAFSAAPMSGSTFGGMGGGMGGMGMGGMGMGGMGMGGMGMGPGQMGMGQMGMGMGQMGMGQMGMGMPGMMGQAGMPGGGFVGANAMGGFPGDPRAARPMQQMGARPMARQQQQRTGQPPVPDLQPGGQGGIRPQQRIAFEYTRPNAAQINSRLGTQFEGLTARRPELNGVRIELDLDAAETVVLRGEVGSDHARRLAESLVRMEPGVRAVRNELTVVGPG